MAYNNKRAVIINQNIKNNIPLNDLGVNLRLHQDLYPEIVFVGSLHCESRYINTTYRSIGMAQNSGQDKFYKPTSSGIFQVSSSSINDTSAGTGARTVNITGLVLNSNGDRIKHSEEITLNGQNAVSTVATNFYRINFISTLTAGSSGFNEGDIYISPNGTNLTLGVPDENIIACQIEEWNNSTMGDFSVATNEAFVFTIGNFFFDPTKTVRIRETFSIDNDILFHVAYYPSLSQSYNYFGAGSYNENTDIMLDIAITSGNLTFPGAYYIEHILVDTTKINNPLSTFKQ